MKPLSRMTLALAIPALLLGACAAPPVVPTATLAPSPIPATLTPIPTSTATAYPSPTPLPGSVSVPLGSLGADIPWLPLVKTERPATYAFLFDLHKPPFDNVLVRKAFAAATDREALAEIARQYGSATAMPATTYTPPQTLGRDLYNQVGIPYDPAEAKDLLKQAGYGDSSSFPAVTLLTNMTGEPAPGAHVKIADAMVAMWQETLGITVQAEVITWNAFNQRIREDPSGIFRYGWAADLNDPDNFLREVFHSGSQYNISGFSNSEFDALVDKARESHDASQRQKLYIQAEQILCEQEVAVIPVYHKTQRPP
jgi:oligopeptide transport system substrate-binding protein